jgi:micrococcal nuclease
MKSLFFVVGFALSGLAFGQVAEVVRIKDGDTLVALTPEKTQITCRLYAIDAPESSQAFGQVSKQSLADLTFRKMVEINIVDTDHYGRSVCKIKRGQIDVNLEQVAKGMAMVYRQYAKGVNDGVYYQVESQAKAKRLGLWQDSNPVEPWNYRHNKGR